MYIILVWLIGMHNTVMISMCLYVSGLICIYYQWWCVVSTVVSLTFSFWTASHTTSGATGSTIAASFEPLSISKYIKLSDRAGSTFTWNWPNSLVLILLCIVVKYLRTEIITNCATYIKVKFEMYMVREVQTAYLKTSSS